ncbi:MAG: hypothetical protein OJF61_002820 [Rhodanobacteraceae bacterium]|jgi:hypothetical protein|nr:MAG: hypothetical protein OJF61_002820 [Rhodanobacteraceae bacterium]
MSITADWSRPHWTRDEAKAMLLYFVFGAFAAEPQLDLSAHGSRGLPQGVEILRIPKDRLAHWEGHPLRGALGEILREGNRTAFDAARKAPECLMLRGELADADSLAYLRDTLGVVAALLDVGGVAVVDPQILEMFTADEWRARYGGAEASVAREHVLVLCQDDTGGSAWIKTRGLRKFARSDISIRRVPQSEVQRAGAIAARLVDLQARGMRFGDGSTVDVDGLPDGLKITRGGSLDDPEFNNTHLELIWPAAGK